jgi:hypothetical protein
MSKMRTYFLQFLGIILLMCGYLVSNQPDSKSVMHFDSDPDVPHVISKSNRLSVNDDAAPTTISSDHHSRHKLKAPVHIAFEMLLPYKVPYVYHPRVIVQHSCPLPEAYAYLFYEEINPPPPKDC